MCPPSTIGGLDVTTAMRLMAPPLRAAPSPSWIEVHGDDADHGAEIAAVTAAARILEEWRETCARADRNAVDEVGRVGGRLVRNPRSGVHRDRTHLAGREVHRPPPEADCHGHAVRHHAVGDLELQCAHAERYDTAVRHRGRGRT